MSHELTVQDASQSDEVFDLVPRNLQEAIQLSELIAKSRFIPKEYQGQPADILVAIQFGHELGFKPLQSLQSIACINGRPTVYGDAMLGIVQQSSVYEWIDESESTPTMGVCIAKRRGHQECRSVFTLDDAKRAGLLGKQGPWQQYPSRMLKLRARGFALRDAFSDVLKGLVTTEEAMDIPPTPTPLDTEKPTTLKDRLKAKVLETTDEILEEQLEKSVEVLKAKGNLSFKDSQDDGVTPAEERPQLGSQQGDDGPGPFTETSAAADYEAAIAVAVNTEEVDGLWNECVKDGRITGPMRAKIYRKVQAKKKAL